jgi:hypothetical protein
MTACENPMINELKQLVKEMDEQCPINLGSMGDIVHVKFDADKREMQWYYAINEDMMTIDAMSKNSQLAKKSFKISLSRPEQKKHIDMLAKHGVGFKAVFKGNTSGKTFTVECTSKDLKDVLEHPMTNREVDEALYEFQIAKEHAMCPQTVEAGVIATSVKDENGSMVYVYEVDEEYCDLSLFDYPQFKKEMRASIQEGFSDPSCQNTIRLLKALDKQLVFRYCGKKSGKTVDLKFTPSEL